MKRNTEKLPSPWVSAIPLAVLIAVFLNKRKAIYNFTQSVVFTPHIISFVSIATLWMFLMDPQFGILNEVLGLFGIQPLMWLLSEDTSLMSIIIVSIWKSLGYNVLIVMSGLQGIPENLYEAARLDRSGKVNSFFRITLPMLSPTFVFLITTTIISTFSTYDLIKLMTQGGPRNSSNLLVYWIYETGYLHFNVGKAMAGGVMLLLFIGGKMVWDTLHEDGKEEEEFANERLDLKELLLMAVATSIDALAMGITFAFLSVSIGKASGLIGCTTFVISALGVFIGNRFGAKYKDKASLTGGIILILIGCKVLLEHLGILG